MENNISHTAFIKAEYNNVLLYRLADVEQIFAIGSMQHEIETIALQHSKYGPWGNVMLNHIVTHEMLRVVDK